MGTFFQNDIDTSSMMNQLKLMNDQELDEILNDPTCTKIDCLIKELPQVKSLDFDRERLILSNKNHAESNLSFETTYRMTRDKLIKELEECQELKSQLDKKKSRLLELSNQYSLDTTLALMQAAMAEAEEASDDVANSFIKKEITIDEFLKDFIEKRKLFHSRRIKVEKMPDEIHKFNNRHLQPVRPAPLPPTSSFSQMSLMNSRPMNTPPYPINPISMPNPRNY